MLSKLHGALTAGEFDAAEKVLEEAREAGLFRLYESSPSHPARRGKTVAKWERILPPPPSSSSSPASNTPSWPPGRGGHQLVRISRKLLLFGGWDGRSDLGDLWEYDLPFSSATYASGADPGGPWKRVERKEGEGDGEWPKGVSCHAMVADEKEGWVYLMGGRRDDPADFAPPASTVRPAGGDGGAVAGGMEVDSAAGAAAGTAAGGEAKKDEDDAWASPLWRYRAVGPPSERGKWECLSRDTRKQGGPGMLYVFLFLSLPLLSSC